MADASTHHDTDPSTGEPDFAPALRDASLRVTRPRLAVLSAVHAEPHLDTEAVTSGSARTSAPSPTRPSTTCSVP